MQGKIKREKNIRRTVLIVDDELINRRILGKIISRDYEVLYAENGAEALRLIREHVKRLSIVLLDLLMPVMTGYELLETMQADEALRRIPVIVLTSETSAEVKSLQLGAADFIPKPYDLPEVIMARVRRSIELAEDSGIINATEIDVLTGLYTRAYFQEYCGKYDLYYADTAMDAIALNINRFHLINALYGRHYGDRLLCTMADVIRDLLDGEVGIACRCEPDTFLIYISKRENYSDLLHQLVAAAERRLTSKQLSMRMGVYPVTDLSVTADARFDCALQACNSLRGSYQSDYAVYDAEMTRRKLYLESLMGGMDAALEEHQFTVYYQPKFNITGDTPVLSSAEALVRWIHPQYGMVSPGVFIPLFENNGMIHRLDRYVWRQAAAQIRRWKEKYHHVLPVSVNVSRADLYDDSLAQELLSIVREEGLEPRDLLLEITESSYADNAQRIKEAVEGLRHHGFFIEMDDFGSGYSSLNSLASLPVDALKLDMKFVRHICTSPKDLRMVELMREIADFLSVPVIAEGVEEEAQYRLLKQVGVDVIQGYYFSKPIPADAFEDLLNVTE